MYMNCLVSEALRPSTGGRVRGHIHRNARSRIDRGSVVDIVDLWDGNSLVRWEDARKQCGQIDIWPVVAWFRVMNVLRHARRVTRTNRCARISWRGFAHVHFSLVHLVCVHFSLVHLVCVHFSPVHFARVHFPLVHRCAVTVWCAVTVRRVESFRTRVFRRSRWRRCRRPRKTGCVCRRFPSCGR